MKILVTAGLFNNAVSNTDHFFLNNSWQSIEKQCQDQNI